MQYTLLKKGLATKLASAIVVAATCFGCSPQKPNHRIIDAKVKILLPEKANEVEKYAAEELKYHLDKALGTQFQIASESINTNRSFAIYIGATKAAKASGLTRNDWKADERRLKLTDAGLFLLGADEAGSRDDLLNTFKVCSRGTLYAVYDFLENEMGVKWLWPGPLGELIPRRDTLALTAIDRAGSEPLDQRYFYGVWNKSDCGFSSRKASERFYDAQSKFLLRHRVGKNTKYGGSHAFGKFWEKYGKEHPEYFNQLPDGERRPLSRPYLATLCVSNPDVHKVIVDNWLAGPAKSVHGGLCAELPLVNCYENDCSGMCTCEKCRAWDAKDPRFALNPYWNGTVTHAEIEKKRKVNVWGWDGLSDARLGIPTNDPSTRVAASLSDRYVKFYNAVCAEARKHVSNAGVIGYAYENYIEAPKETKIADGVVIEYVPRSYWPYDKAESDFFRKTFVGWNEAGAKKILLRPNYMLAGGNYLFDQGRLILEDFAFAYKHGMKACAFDSLRGSWAAHTMMDYAMVRALRDPLHSYDQARQEMLLAFGSASEPINRYFEAIHRETTRRSLSEVMKIAADNFSGRASGGSFGNCPAIVADIFTDDFLKQMHGLLDEAVKAAKGDEIVIARIEFLRKGLRDTELTRNTRIAQKRRDANPTEANKAAFNRAFDEMLAFRHASEPYFILNGWKAAQIERAIGWQYKPWPKD